MSLKKTSEKDGAFDVLIMGSGPAGYTASIYAARAGRRTCLIAGFQVGGQLMITSSVENFPGFDEPISGTELMEHMQKQSEKVGVKIVYDVVSAIDFEGCTTKDRGRDYPNKNYLFKCNCESGNVYASKALIVATGATAKWLGVPGEVVYRGRGVSACATCDGFFFRNKDVVVVGGGNVAVEDAIFLSNFAKSVTLIHRRSQLRAEKVMQKQLFKNPKVQVVWNTVVEEIEGNGSKVTGVKLRSTIGERSTTSMSTDGVFVAIGHHPSTSFLRGHIDLDAAGYVITKPAGSVFTNIPGVFVAGDVCDPVYRQAITSAGQGCMAAIEADKFLEGSSGITDIDD